MKLLLATMRGFSADDGGTMAAAIAYYALFSFFPLILLGITLVSFFVTSATAQEHVETFVRGFWPFGSEFVQANIEQILRARESVGILALLGLVWSASGVFAAMERALNRAWGVDDLRPYWARKVMALVMAVAAGGLFVLSVLLTTFFHVLWRLKQILPGVQPFGDDTMRGLASSLLPVLSGILVFLLLYKILPNTRVRWSDVWPGAVAAGLTWEAAKLGFTWYLTNLASYNLVYGSVAIIIGFLMWNYLTALILILGAEFTAKYALARRTEDIANFRPFWYT